MDNIKVGMTVASVYYPNIPLVVEAAFKYDFYSDPDKTTWYACPQGGPVFRVRNTVTGNWMNCEACMLCEYQPAESPHHFAD